MKRLKQPILLLSLISMSLLLGCDPTHRGDAMINNQSDYELKLHFNTVVLDSSITIPAHSAVNIYHFVAASAGQDITCCPCELPGLTLGVSDTTKVIDKSILETTNWQMSNDNHNHYSHKVIGCTFLIEAGNIH